MNMSNLRSAGGRYGASSQRTPCTPISATPHTVLAKSGAKMQVKLTARKAIKLHCTQCMGYEGDPKECGIETCPLYLYRGKTLITYKN